MNLLVAVVVITQPPPTWVAGLLDCESEATTKNLSSRAEAGGDPCRELQGLDRQNKFALGLCSQTENRACIWGVLAELVGQSGVYQVSLDKGLSA